jgi:aspartate 1-decarboxylase
VFVSQSTAVFTQTGGSAISYNRAGAGGGGVCVSLGQMELSGGQIAGNVGYDGGGVYVGGGNARLIQSGDSLIASNVVTGSGGGVYIEQGRVELNGGQILSNTATDGGGVYVYQATAAFTQTGGGGIAYNLASNNGGGVYVNSGRATLDRAYVLSNTASQRGGGLYAWGGTLTLVNATVSRNSASNVSGGGLYANGGATVLTYTTFASNTASSGGGGLHQAGGAITLQNTIVAGNGPANCSGALTSNGYNLDSGVTCNLNAMGDMTGTDPMLGQLTGQGVHPLLAGSPAIDKGICVAGITTDQRGVTRPQGISGKCDMGAYEYAPVAVTSVSINGPTMGVINQDYVFTATASPPTATLPITYTWSPAPASGQNTRFAAYRWTEAGDKMITVAAENTGDTAVQTHTLTIVVQVQSVGINGPTAGFVNQSYTFTATVSPITATQPFTYTWYPAPISGQGASVAVYSWTVTGAKAITVTAANIAGSMESSPKPITITQYKVYLPVVIRN